MYIYYHSGNSPGGVPFVGLKAEQSGDDVFAPALPPFLLVTATTHALADPIDRFPLATCRSVGDERKSRRNVSPVSTHTWAGTRVSVTRCMLLRLYAAPLRTSANSSASFSTSDSTCGGRGQDIVPFIQSQATSTHLALLVLALALGVGGLAGVIENEAVRHPRRRTTYHDQARNCRLFRVGKATLP
jgi:hypothetical protein